MSKRYRAAEPRQCVVYRPGGWGTAPSPCPHEEAFVTQRGPLPLCIAHIRRHLIVPPERPTKERLERMVEDAVLRVPQELADELLHGWSPRDLWHAWRWTAWDGRPAIPIAVKRAVYERDGHVCLLCGSTERLSLDHIQPYSRGGRDTVENLRVLCLPCNVRRGAPEEWQVA